MWGARPNQTYPLARAAILGYLKGIGWTVKADLKVPQAITPSGHVVRFKAQAVYLDAHSLWIDIREHDGASFVVAVEQRIAAI